nr:substrate-binding domain-containing protein [Rathayibacter tritici]
MAAIRRPLRPSVVIASSTPLAVQALERLRAEGLAIPRDIAFATFDGFDHADLFEPALTTIRQPGFDMGTAAVRLLLERIERPASPPHRAAAADPRASDVDRSVRVLPVSIT